MLEKAIRDALMIHLDTGGPGGVARSLVEMTDGFAAEPDPGRRRDSITPSGPPCFAPTPSPEPAFGTDPSASTIIGIPFLGIAAAHSQRRVEHSGPGSSV